MFYTGARGVDGGPQGLVSMEIVAIASQLTSWFLFVCVIVIYLISLGATKFIQDEQNQGFMGILAGIILVVFGTFYFKKEEIKCYFS